MRLDREQFKALSGLQQTLARKATLADGRTITVRPIKAVRKEGTK